jgi:hypothetical protein
MPDLFSLPHEFMGSPFMDIASMGSVVVSTEKGLRVR